MLGLHWVTTFPIILVPGVGTGHQIELLPTIAPSSRPSSRTWAVRRVSLKHVTTVTRAVDSYIVTCDTARCLLLGLVLSALQPGSVTTLSTKTVDRYSAFHPFKCSTAIFDTHEHIEFEYLKYVYVVVSECWEVRPCGG